MGWIDPIDGFQSLVDYNDEKRYAEVCAEYEKKYKEYQKSANEKQKKYAELRENYNAEIAIINNERISMRIEIQKLYVFLKSIGGSMGERVTPFDFEKEAPVYNANIPFVDKLPKLEIENWHFIDGPIRISFVKGHNKSLIEDFALKSANEGLKYQNDYIKRDQMIRFVEDACEIAKIYRQIVVTVRDSIRDKIIPEMNLVKSFLYADTIRERILDRDNLENIKPYSIEEYQGTRQDVHYQFVKNTVDFYNLIVKFFSEKILTQIIEDQQVTQAEKHNFKTQVDAVKKHITNVEREMVN